MKAVKEAQLEEKVVQLDRKDRYAFKVADAAGASSMTA